jgi:hypothetical protein
MFEGTSSTSEQKIEENSGKKRAGGTREQNKIASKMLQRTELLSEQRFKENKY